MHVDSFGKDGLGRPYRIRIIIGFILVIGTTIACILTNFLACRPFSRYWQLNPDPGSKRLAKP
jgi:hypothetical protein